MCCCFTFTVNNNGHVGMVSAPNHTIPGQAKIFKAVNKYSVLILSPKSPFCVSGRGGGRRNNFIINFHESLWPARV